MWCRISHKPQSSRVFRIAGSQRCLCGCDQHASWKLECYLSQILPLRHRSKWPISWNEPDTLSLWSTKSQSHFHFFFFQSLALNGAEMWIKRSASHFSTLPLSCSSQNLFIIANLSLDLTFKLRNWKSEPLSWLLLSRQRFYTIPL